MKDAMRRFTQNQPRRAARCLTLLAACALIPSVIIATPTVAQKSRKVSRGKPAASSKPVASKKRVAATTPPASRIVVQEIDAAAFAKLLPQSGAQNPRPVLINFWATWCEPCRVEFPDLVKIDNEFRTGGLDFFTVSLDDPAEIATSVPAFLQEMRAERIPAYLLNTPEPADAINAVDKTWTGALPATFLFNRRGELVYKHTGLIKPAELKAKIKKSLSVNGK
jgi:thiol-disulfide isomerase/thioredoxin